MFKLYSKGCEYALRALMHMANGAVNELFQARDVCEKADVPEAFTRKVFQTLAQQGILKAVSGPGGGYRFAHDPYSLSLLTLVKAIDGEDSYNHCIMGLPECGGDCPCPLHGEWSKTKTRLVGQLEATTLGQLLATERQQLQGRRKKTQAGKGNGQL